jgi:gliding motility-associated-like protein
MTMPGAVDKKYVLGWTLGLIFALSSISPAVAQVSSATADHVDTLAYLPGNTARDPLFVFYQTDQVYKPGSLSARYPGSGSFNFEWRKYNPGTSGFDPAFSSDLGSTSSSVSNLEEGGYRVRVWNGSGIDTTMMSWVMLDLFSNDIEKTHDGLLPGYRYTCDYVSLAGYVYPDTLVYYDLVSNTAISRILDYRFKWTSDNADLDIPNDSIVLRPNTTYKPPYKDTEYYLTATDEYGMTDVDTMFYESIQTKAEFSVEYYDKVTGEYDPGLTGNWDAEKGSLDARLSVRFLNSSQNGAIFNWVYLDTLGGVKESEITYDLEAITEFTYINAGKYYNPFLVSMSEENCQDTFRLAEEIFVVPSQLAIPNVFSPNGDGTNDYFVFKHQSLEKCQVSIMTRNGIVVYKRKIEDIYSWDGWDGNMHSSNRKAPEGQYYYVVEAIGYDGVEYQDPTIIDKWKGNSGSGSTPGGSTPGGTDPEAVSQTRYIGWLYLYRDKAGY